MSREYYVYILANQNNNVLYIGVTSDLVTRIQQHKEKALDGFTEKYSINKLVYYEFHNDIYDAISREKKVKKLA